MSATRWSTCPKCVKKGRQEIKDLENRLDLQYGKVDKATYEALKQDVDARRLEVNRTDKPTLREDYYIGFHDDGRFYVNYNAECQTCGLVHAYQYAKQKQLT